MTEPLRAQGVLPEDQSSVLSTSVVTYEHITPDLKGLLPYSLQVSRIFTLMENTLIASCVAGTMQIKCKSLSSEQEDGIFTMEETSLA